MKRSLFVFLLFPILTTLVLKAEERTMTPEQMEALLGSGDFSEEQELERPKNLPDLTKGGVIRPGKSAPPVWTLGPTGIVGQLSGKEKGDQILVHGSYPSSPSEGKFLKGDVILGMNGKKFVAGGNLGILIGNTIMEAEKAENGGKISFLVWRDRNFAARSVEKDVVAVDVESLFKAAEDDNSLYDWKSDEERKEEIKNVSYAEFPIDPTMLEINLTLRTLPAYADTAPYDCPKTKLILEEAYKVLEKKFIFDPKDVRNRRNGRGGMIEAIALISSGKPEHRKLIHDWVRGPHSPWKPPTGPTGEIFSPDYKRNKGYMSWILGFTGLHCALYYEATGDEYVLPALRKLATEVAMGQSWLGSWGHTFAFPSFNGGEFNQMNPGYGALNAAGNHCFMLVTMAQKLGIKAPEIDAAVERGRRFFGSYTDLGCIPYGDHGAADSDDSNGKNTGVAFAMKLLGDNHKAKYFAMMSSHCAFTRRGGHGHDYNGEWSSWAATLCGPEVRIMNERNLRWRRTLCRMHDGSFIYNSPTNYRALRDPTSTEVFHQAVIYGQTLITGKDPDKNLYPTEREMKQLIASARSQFNDPILLEKAGTPWWDRPTEEVLDLLDIFYPKGRSNIAGELAKRYKAGETDIVPKLVALLDNPEPRFRDGALRTLGACGNDVVLSALSAIVKCISDPADFVRIKAISVVSRATNAEADNKDIQLAMLEATVKPPQAIAPNSVRNVTQGVLFGGDHPLANLPFDAGFDKPLIRQALEELILTDPGGARFLNSRKTPWNKDTVAELAGPLTFIAEEEQIGDQMFGSRSAGARALLNKFGFLEAAESTVHRLRKKSELPRSIRPFVTYKNPIIDPVLISAKPAVFANMKDSFKTILIDNPNESITVKNDSTGGKSVIFEFDKLLEKIESAKGDAEMPKIADEAARLFRTEMTSLASDAARIEACRAELADPQRKSTFRMFAAMEILVHQLKAKALPDLAPYFGQSYWRLRDRSRELAVPLVKAGGAELLLTTLKETTDPSMKAGILTVLATAGEKSAIAPARANLKDSSPAVRIAAMNALLLLGGDSLLPELITHFAATRERHELARCEEVFLAAAKNTQSADAIRDGLIKIMPRAEPAIKASTYYVLARLGDPKSIATLKKAADTNSASELEEIVMALSYSPSREADKILVEIAAKGKKQADIVGGQSVRRMVLGPKGYGDINDSQRMDFAEPMVKLNMDGRLVQYLGRISDARALRALMGCLERGYTRATDSIISNAERLDNLNPAETKLVLETIRNVIEYIEVTHLRGGASSRIGQSTNYPHWKNLQARAGKIMLKLHKPEKAPIQGFDPLDID